MKRKPLFLFCLTFVFTEKTSSPKSSPKSKEREGDRQRKRGRETFGSVSLEKEAAEEEEEASTCFFERGRAWHSWRRSA